MTDEHEHAMKVWLYSSGYEGNADVEQAVREFASVIAADRAGLVARVAELEGQISDCRGCWWVGRKELQGRQLHLDAVWRGLVETDDAARSALKDTRHDAD